MVKKYNLDETKAFFHLWLKHLKERIEKENLGTYLFNEDEDDLEVTYSISDDAMEHTTYYVSITKWGGEDFDIDYHRIGTGPCVSVNSGMGSFEEFVKEVHEWVGIKD